MFTLSLITYRGSFTCAQVKKYQVDIAIFTWLTQPFKRWRLLPFSLIEITTKLAPGPRYDKCHSTSNFNFQSDFAYCVRILLHSSCAFIVLLQWINGTACCQMRNIEIRLFTCVQKSHLCDFAELPQATKQAVMRTG